MNDILIFALIVVLGIVPFGFGIMYFLYRGTIVLIAASIVFIAAMFTGIVSFAISELGFNSLFWAIPLCLIALVSVNAIFKNKIQRPLKKLNESLISLSKGVLDIEISEKTLQLNNEIGMVAKSLNTTLQGLHNTSNFAAEIAKGALEVEYKLLSKDDEIGLALINMQKSLNDASELDKKRKIEEQQANYITNGIAKFSDLLRVHTDNVGKLVGNIMNDLVDYVGAVQGGMFVLNEEDEGAVHYELAGAVAFDRERMFNRKIYVGEGLVGRCVFEKLPIMLTEVPDNYMNITSGLGDANPQCILLVPAIVDDKVYAVIELASFKVFDKHLISFIEKIAENIASVISNVRGNERTARLLEDSKANSEEMAAQEEELRQNIEELQTTQEEMQRKELQLKEMSAKLEEQEEIIKQKMKALSTKD